MQSVFEISAKFFRL